MTSGVGFDRVPFVADEMVDVWCDDASPPVFNAVVDQGRGDPLDGRIGDELEAEEGFRRERNDSANLTVSEPSCGRAILGSIRQPCVRSLW